MKNISEQDLDRPWTSDEVADLTDREVVVLAFKRDWKNFIYFLPVAFALYFVSVNLGKIGQIIGWGGVIMFVFFALSGILNFLIGIFVLVTSPFTMDATKEASMKWRIAGVLQSGVNLVVFGGYALIVYTGIVGSAESPSIDTESIPQATVDVLKQNFNMTEVVSLISASTSRSASKEYLEARITRFGFMATQNQDPMVVDGYTVLDTKSPIIGYSLFYYGDNGPLAFADATVNPLQKDAVDAADKLIAASLESVSNPDGSKMYFLGIHKLDTSRVLKIMIRTAQSSMGTDYVLRYVVSK